MDGDVNYLALRCFSCQMFQVNRKTKSGKWKCSMCGAGQSVVKVWGRGDRAKDVRGLVMDLNAAAGREDLTATLRKAAAAASTSLPPPHQTRDGRGDAAPAALSRSKDPLGRAALLTSSGTALQPRRFAEGMAKARRFAEGMTEPGRFAESKADTEPVDTRQARFDEPAPSSFMSGRDRSRLDSLGSRAGERPDGGSMGEHVWHERQNGEYAGGALSAAVPGGGYRARESVGTQPFREQVSPRQSAIGATDRGSKVSRWGAFAFSRGIDIKIDGLEKRHVQTVAQQVEGDPIFVTSLPETSAPSTHRRGNPNQGLGRKRALSSTLASRGAREESGRREGQTDTAYGRVPLVGQAPGGGEQQQIGQDSLGKSRGEVEVCDGRRGGDGSRRVFVGELDRNADFSGSRVSWSNGSAGVDGGKRIRPSRWSKFV